MITIYFNDNFNNLTLKNLTLDFENCCELFLKVMEHVDNSFGVSVNSKTIQFYKEDEEKILVEIINNPSLINNQMFSNTQDSLSIIKNIYDKENIEAYPQMKLVDIKRQSLNDILLL